MFEKIINGIAIAILVIIGAPVGLAIGFFVWPIVLLPWAADRMQKRYGSLWISNWTDTLFTASVIIGAILTLGWWVFIGMALTLPVWGMVKHRPS